MMTVDRQQWDIQPTEPLVEPSDCGCGDGAGAFGKMSTALP